MASKDNKHESCIDWNMVRQVDRNGNKIHDKLDEIIARNKDIEVKVTVLLSRDDEEAIRKFEKMGGVVTHVWKHAICGFAGKIKAGLISLFARHPTVVLIEPEMEVYLLG